MTVSRALSENKVQRPYTFAERTTFTKVEVTTISVKDGIVPTFNSTWQNSSKTVFQGHGMV
jgi:hypothetical protein